MIDEMRRGCIGHEGIVLVVAVVRRPDSCHMRPSRYLPNSIERDGERFANLRSTTTFALETLDNSSPVLVAVRKSRE